MQRKQHAHQNTHRRVIAEAVEQRLLFAFPLATALSGADNPFEGIDIGYLSAPAFGDPDGDGDTDLVIGAESGGMRYWKNTGTATNPVYVEQGGAANPFGVAGASDGKPTLADVDTDGDLDLLVGEIGGRTFYFKNTGTRTSPTYTQQTGTANPFAAVDPGFDCAPALGDMDGDGDLDVVVGERGSALQYWKNTGTPINPVFTQQTGAANPFGGIGGSYATPTLADADGDGDLDLFMGDLNGAPSAVRYFRNTGNANNPLFAQQAGELSVFTWPAPAVADVDGDGDLDFLVGGNWGGLTYFRGEAAFPTIGYTQRTSTANPFNGFDVGNISVPALGDVDGDGDPDAVVGAQGGTLRYFRNTGSATSPMYAQQIGTTNPFVNVVVGGMTAPALGDVDGDGDLDAVVGDNNGTLSYFKNTGNVTSPVYTQQTGAANPFNAINAGNRSAPALGDIDGDGDLDLAVGWLGGNVYYFKNTGTATSPTYTQQTGAANPLGAAAVDFYSTPALGDIDGDGDLDAVIGGQSRFLYLKNTGTVTSPVYTLQSGAADPFNALVTLDFASPALADVDGDGDADAVVGISDGTLNYLRKNRSPVAVNDTYTMNQDTSLVANGTGGNPPGVLDNDVIIEGSSMTAVLVSPPAHGGLFLPSNGVVFYTPAAGYSGTDSFTYRTNGNGLNSSTATVTINVLDTVRPTVQASQFFFERPPQSIAVQFSENVSDSLSIDDIVVTHLSSGASVPFSLMIGSRDATLIFNSILADGDYRMRILAAGVTDAAGNAMAADYDLNFFFLAGDANRDRTVNLLDFNTLASNFGQPNRTFSQGDFNYDGAVNLLDFNILASHFGQSLGPDGMMVRTGAQLSARPSTFGQAMIGPNPARDNAVGDLLTQAG
jgi:hypothetical protein